MATLKSGTTAGGSTVLTESSHNNTGDPHDQYKLISELTAEYYTSATVDTLLAANSLADQAASAGFAAAAEISATNAAASETNASNSASQASVSATNADTSAGEAATSEANAALSESNAASSETAAGVSETNAAASEAAAGVSETNAAASELAAGVSETNAAASELAAENAKTAAEAAQSLTEGIYDSFDDRYLGAKASDPTLDNDGDALITGALYFDTTDGVMKAYDGAAWGEISAGGGATGGGTDEVFYENAQNVTVDYTITSGSNAMTTGPLTIDTGVTVTVPTGSTWVIL